MDHYNLPALAARFKEAMANAQPVLDELRDACLDTLSALDATALDEATRHAGVDEISSVVPAVNDADTEFKELSQMLMTYSKIAMDRKMNLVMHDGLRKIPDEVLLRIFELGYFTQSPHVWSHRYAIRLSHVSRRFRAVAFKLPVLWASVSDKMNQNQLDAFVQRSKQGPLSVSYNESRIRGDLCEVVARQSHRIVTLHSYSGEKSYKLLERLKSESEDGPMDFGCLQSLHLWNSDTEREGTELSLHAPQLECLKMRNIVPTLFAPSLTRMTYEVHSRNLDYEWSAGRLLNLLGSLPNLDVFDLSVGHAHEPTDAHYETAVVSATKLRIIVNSENVGHISAFLAALDLPQLANLTVHIPGCYTTSFLRALVPERCPSLKKVKVCLSSRNAPSRASATHIVLSCFPQIHHLVLSNARFTDSTRNSLARISLYSLQSLVLSYCYVEEAELLPLVEKLVATVPAGQQNPTFKELSLVGNCRSRRYSQLSVRSNDVNEMENLGRLLGNRLTVMDETTWSRDSRNSWLS